MKQNDCFRDLTGTICVVGLACLSHIGINNTSPIRSENPPIWRAKTSYCDKNLSGPSFLLDIGNIYKQQSKTKLEKEAIALFGSMRDATSSERNDVKQYIDSISTDTGFNFYDLC
ncbi:MAG: hypothetical protein BWY02_01799 [bacterium ADurb.Bin157]|nr:MAG: hypothetical protein BWY02_01799 [bacterium ADurb.Bin157]